MRHQHYVHDQKTKTRAHKIIYKIIGALASLLLVLGPVASFILPDHAQAAVPGDVFINEFSVKPSGKEWIELYNNLGTPVQLENWKLTEISGSSETDLVIFGAADVIPANGFLVYDIPGSKLNDSGDTITLYDDSVPAAVQIDQRTYDNAGAPDASKSAGRKIDGGSGWKIFDAPTKGFSNTSAKIRVHQKPDSNKDKKLNISEANQHESGWTVRLYHNDWSQANFAPDNGNAVVTTDKPFGEAAVFYADPSQDYYACVVGQLGYKLGFTATVTSVVTWDDNSIENTNPNQPADEENTCIEISGLTPGKVSTQVFGHYQTHVPPVAQLQNDQIIRPVDFANAMSTWTYHDDAVSPLVAATPDENDTHSIKPNPILSLDDYGAVRLSVNSGEKWNLASLQYSGTKLANIAALGFNVYTDQPGKAYINLDINFGEGLSGWQGRLVYVPSVTANTWESIEAVDGGTGKWKWSSMMPGNPANKTTWPDGETSSERTWNDIVDAFPDAYISHSSAEAVLGGTPFGSLYLRADGTSTTYYDMVYLATETENIRYNFEPQTVEDGRIHIHAVQEINGNNFPDWYEDGPEPHEQGWTMRLYDNSPGAWQPVNALGDTTFDNEVVTTGNYYQFSAKFIVQPGVYHVCEVLPSTHTLGFAQTVTGWFSTDNTGVPNLSPNAAEETPECIKVAVLPGQQSAHVFGNVPVTTTTTGNTDDTEDGEPQEPGGTGGTPQGAGVPQAEPPQQFAAFAAPAAFGVLGDNDDAGDDDDDADDGTGTLGDTIETTPTDFAIGGVLGDSDGNWFAANWKWLLLLLPLLLLIFFLLARKKEDEQEPIFPGQ